MPIKDPLKRREYNKKYVQRTGYKYHKVYSQTENGRQKHRDAQNRYRNKLRGTTIASKSSMLMAQNGICGNPGCTSVITIKSPLDHNHETGAIRSILCHGCNVSLGFLRESKDRILGLVQYLDLHIS